MPYEIKKDATLCSESKPWAVVKKGTKKKFGCHASKADAQKQVAALYANETDAVSQGVTIESTHLSMIHAASTVVEGPEKLSVPQITFEHDGIVLARMTDVPLFKVGMKFPASTGNVDFSFQHLAASVSSESDPMIPRPRIKLGHTDPRYNDCPCPSCGAVVKFDFQSSSTFDGDPGFGFVENQHLSANGGTVIADLVDVPLWLAKIMPVAFSSRSIEGWFGYVGPNEKQYDFITTAVALLGVCFPGVINLQDLPQMYGSEKPDYVVVQQEAA